MNQLHVVLFAFIASIGVQHTQYAYTIESQMRENQINTDHAQSKTISFPFKLNKDELLYTDTLQVTVNNPNISLSKLVADKDAETKFDSAFNETKQGYTGNVTLSLIATLKDANKPSDGTIALHFFVSSVKKPQEISLPISFAQQGKPEAIATNNKAIQQVAVQTEPTSATHGIMQKIAHKVSAITQKWYTALTSLFEDTGSYWLRYLLALLLGILLSLTPCIYPMIPVTIGVLQANKSSSPFKNFILALAYTLGISITFATLGFIAALSSSVFGQLQTSPWVVLPVILVLIYLGLSMFGLYEMYIPRFMQPKNSSIKGGSLSSAFIFGAISGTVASPCLSPGLALIITYVHKITQTGSAFGYLQGFLLLFAFGIGTSLPLLIIGTFSSSLNILPRAGMWMVEVKRILGLMLIAMAFYYMQNIIPWSILVWVITAFMLVIGIYYFADIKSYDGAWARRYKYFFGTLCCVGACFMAFQGIKSMYSLTASKDSIGQSQSLWLTDYEAARAQATTENKRLILDFGTTWCAACKKLDKDILSRVDVQEALKNYIQVKVDATDPSSEPFLHLQKPLNIKGFPTIVILDAKDESEIKQWVGYFNNPQEFISELQHYKQ